MTELFNEFARRLRRAAGSSGDQAPDLPLQFEHRSGRDLLHRKRLKVALMAILFGLVSAVIELPLPAEDFYKAARAQLRTRPAPQDIAFIAIDDKTLAAFNREYPNRAQDSQLIDTLIASGVERVVFDRAHAGAQAPAVDAKFVQTLERHRGRVWLGFIPEQEAMIYSSPEIAPLPAFRERANLATMLSRGSPFGLAISLPTLVEFDGKQEQSISAVLAGYDGPERMYRVDYAFNLATIPSYSYHDVLTGKVPASALKGKKVVIGEAYFLSEDYYFLPFDGEGRVPGAYFHVLGAHTLKQGTPIDLMWFPAMALAAGAILLQALGRRRSARPMWIATLGLLAVTFVLDEFVIHIDIMSALLAMAGAGWGFRRINRKYFSADVDAMTTTAIGSDQPSAGRDVYALKIANLAELSEDWSARETGDFVNTLIAYVKGPGEAGDVAFERDLLVWLAPRMDTADLERHADGLALMLKTAISYEWQSSNGAPALGIDTNHDLPVSLRIKKAMQAADEAAVRGLRYVINDAAHLEARNNRLELIRVLEHGLRDRSITVAYQPKIDLISGRIVGAETLIRWKPDGRELINAQELVLAAEAGDRINELTLVVLETALLDGKQAIALDPRFKLAVNMSAKSLSDTHLLFDIMTMLGRFDFPPENLTLELTETAKLEDHRIAPQVAALKARGIGLSIDDFGTGQSNLEYIEKLPSSELKIDKRFVQQMSTSEESLAVVRATIEIAHSLGKVVVAEGVETPEIAETLRAMGCDQAQGYLFSQAIDLPELLAMMGGRKAVING